MIKYKPYRGQKLKGTWEVSTKIDGVNATFNQEEETVTSKRGKPLHNLDHLLAYDYEGTYEVYLGNWSDSVSAVRTMDGEPINPKYLYKLGEDRDERLHLGYWIFPSPEEIQELLDNVVSQGFEGLILTQGTINWKVKPSLTIDIKVTDVIEGKGKYQGKIGALMTDYGKVGSGLTDVERELDPSEFIDSIIEVELMEWTKDNKMRHPRFLRMRWDKVEENLERDDTTKD